MQRAMRCEVTIKRRPPATSNGVQGVPEVHISSLKTTPVDPFASDRMLEIREAYKIEFPYNVYACYCEATNDIRSGDILVYNGIEYVVCGVAAWDDGDETLYELVLKDTVTT